MLPDQVQGSFCASAVTQSTKKCLQHRHAVVVELRWVRQQGREYKCDPIERLPYVKCSLFFPAIKRRHSVATRKGMEHGKGECLFISKFFSDVMRRNVPLVFASAESDPDSTRKGMEHGKGECLFISKFFSDVYAGMYLWCLPVPKVTQISVSSRLTTVDTARTRTSVSKVRKMSLRYPLFAESTGAFWCPPLHVCMFQEMRCPGVLKSTAHSGHICRRLFPKKVFYHMVCQEVE